MKKMAVLFCLIFIALITSSCVFTNTRVFMVEPKKVYEVRILNSANDIGVMIQKSDISKFCNLAKEIAYDSKTNELYDYDFLIEITYRNFIIKKFDLLYLYNNHIYSSQLNYTSRAYLDFCVSVEEMYNSSLIRLLTEV